MTDQISGSDDLDKSSHSDALAEFFKQQADSRNQFEAKFMAELESIKWHNEVAWYFAIAGWSCFLSYVVASTILTN